MERTIIVVIGTTWEYHPACAALTWANDPEGVVCPNCRQRYDRLAEHVGGIVGAAMLASALGGQVLSVEQLSRCTFNLSQRQDEFQLVESTSQDAGPACIQKAVVENSRV